MKIVNFVFYCHPVNTAIFVLHSGGSIKRSALYMAKCKKVPVGEGSVLEWHISLEIKQVLLCMIILL